MLKRRGVTVEQLSLLAPTESESTTSLWDLLDDEQRAEIVTILARLMARTVPRSPEDEEVEDADD